jgi:exodeoxyribonuclease VII small subunit
METELNFEGSLKQLERTVRALEGGELGLDAALEQYEGGIRLLAGCHKMLEEAGKKVAILVAVNEQGEPETAPFDATATMETAPGKKGKKRKEDEGVDGLPF